MQKATVSRATLSYYIIANNLTHWQVAYDETLNYGVIRSHFASILLHPDGR